MPFQIPATPPLIIGATGGSGTRVIARIARDAGYKLGTNLNPPEDALDFLPLHEKWINRYLRSTEGRPGTSVAELPERFRREFDDTLERLLSGESDPPRWGWKAPRSIYLLPYYKLVYPGLKFIHVIRDGRDMALSKNQNQLRDHGARLLGWKERLLQPRPIRSIMLWDRVNDGTARFCERELGSNYLQIRFEDLCSQPIETVSRMLQFVGASGNAEQIAAERIQPPSTLQRWRRSDPGMVRRMEAAAGTSLRRFGYLVAETLQVV